MSAGTGLECLVQCGSVCPAQMGSKASSLSVPTGDVLLTGAQMIHQGALVAQYTANEGMRNIKGSIPPVGNVLFSEGKVAKSTAIEYHVPQQSRDSDAR